MGDSMVRSTAECCTSNTMCDPALIVPTAPSPYFGTVDILPGLILDTDTSDYINIKPSGKSTVNMFNGVNFHQISVRTFQAKFQEGLTVQVSVHNDVKKAK